VFTSLLLATVSQLTKLSLSHILRPTVSRPVYFGINHDQICITVRQLSSLTRGRVCRFQLLLLLASAVIFGSDSHGTRDHILLSQIGDFSFRRLLRLAGLRWRYSIPPPHGSGQTKRMYSWIICKYSVRTSQGTQWFSITKSNHLIVFRIIIIQQFVEFDLDQNYTQRRKNTKGILAVRWKSPCFTICTHISY
jgi:hypothetical protein